MTGEVRLVQPVRAPRAALWHACATREGLSTWYADRVSGLLEEGGAIHLDWPDLRVHTELQVVELAPDRRIAFENGESNVRLTVLDGAVELLHDGLPSNDDVEGFRSSWRVSLAHLAHALEVHPGRERRTAWLAGRARTSPELAHLYFSEPEAVGSWLGSDPRMGAEGEPYALWLRTGDPLTGRVLVRAEGRDVALVWRELHDSVLTLRTLPTPEPGTRVVAMCLSSWVPDALSTKLRSELGASIDRLLYILEQTGNS